MAKMKSLEFIDNEDLEDAVNRLLAAKARGEHVYLDFLGHRLESDTVDMDTAFLTITKKTKAEWDAQEERERKEYEEKRRQEMIEESFKVNRKNAIIGVLWAKLLFLTKDGKTICYQAEDYIDTFQQYLPYIKPEERENFINEVRTTVYSVGPNTTFEKLDFELKCYEIAGKIMQYMANGVSWEELQEYVQFLITFGEEFIEARKLIKRFSFCSDDFEQFVVSDLHKQDPHRFRLRRSKRSKEEAYS